jgi:hypothetical protein
MDLQETIRQLGIQKRQVELAITELEQLQRRNGSAKVMMPNRRGRKSMASEERKQVSERMKTYWANRREKP